MRGWRRKEGYLVSLVCFPQSTTPPRARNLQQTTLPQRHFRWVEALETTSLEISTDQNARVNEYPDHHLQRFI